MIIIVVSINAHKTERIINVFDKNEILMRIHPIKGYFVHRNAYIFICSRHLSRVCKSRIIAYCVPDRESASASTEYCQMDRKEEETEQGGKKKKTTTTLVELYKKEEETRHKTTKCLLILPMRIHCYYFYETQLYNIRLSKILN